MQTFSAALQSVTADGQNIRLAVEPGDYGICSLTVNDKQIARFTRNGLLIGVEDVPPPPPAKEEAGAPMAASATASHKDEPKGKSK